MNQLPHKFIPAAVLFATAVAIVSTAAFAQAAAPADDRPDPREIPLPPIKTNLPAMPGVNDLPVRTELPDIMTMNDGTKVTTLEQWKKRREEMRAILAYYAVGRMPPAPGNVQGRTLKSETVLDGKVRYRLVHLTFGPGEKLFLDIGIFTPMMGGPFPTLILQGTLAPGSTQLPRLAQGFNQNEGADILLKVGAAGSPARLGMGPPAPAATVAAEHSDVFRRGYALVVYNNNDCAEDTTLREADGSFSFRHTRFFPAYPGYDWGILAAWAWGASRVADYLETDPAIDRTKLIISGESRLGKSSLVAAAFDDRLIGAPVVTGGGGMGAYRYTGPRHSETLDAMVKKYPNWFSPQLHEFWGQREKLPFDQHWFLALCAPRPFIALEGDTDTISLPDAVEHSIRAAWPAYELFGAKDRLGLHYSHHGHIYNAEDRAALMDFVDKNLRGLPVAATFDHFMTVKEIDAALADAAFELSPATRSTGVNPDTLLIITFSSPPTLGESGQIRICDNATNEVVDILEPGTVREEASPVVTIRGNTATIHPHAHRLAYGRKYYVQVDPGVLNIASGEFTHVGGVLTWNFTTKDAAP